MRIHRSLRCSADDPHYCLADQHRQVEWEDGVITGARLRGTGHGELPHHSLQPLLSDEDVDLLNFGDAFEGDRLTQT